MHQTHKPMRAGQDLLIASGLSINTASSTQTLALQSNYEAHDKNNSQLFILNESGGIIRSQEQRVW